MTARVAEAHACAGQRLAIECHDFPELCPQGAAPNAIRGSLGPFGPEPGAASIVSDAPLKRALPRGPQAATIGPDRLLQLRAGAAAA